MKTLLAVSLVLLSFTICFAQPSQRTLQIVSMEGPTGLMVSVDTDSLIYNKDSDRMKALVVMQRGNDIAYYDVEANFRERQLCHFKGCLEPEPDEVSGAIYKYLYTVREKNGLFK